MTDAHERPLPRLMSNSWPDSDDMATMHRLCGQKAQKQINCGMRPPEIRHSLPIDIVCCRVHPASPVSTHTWISGPPLNVCMRDGPSLDVAKIARTDGTSVVHVWPMRTSRASTQVMQPPGPASQYTVSPEATMVQRCVRTQSLSSNTPTERFSGPHLLALLPNVEKIR